MVRREHSENSTHMLIMTTYAQNSDALQDQNGYSHSFIQLRTYIIWLRIMFCFRRLIFTAYKIMYSNWIALTNFDTLLAIANAINTNQIFVIYFEWLVDIYNPIKVEISHKSSYGGQWFKYFRFISTVIFQYRQQYNSQSIRLFVIPVVSV